MRNSFKMVSSLQQIINLLFEAGDPFLTVHLWLKKEYQGFRHTCSSR